MECWIRTSSHYASLLWSYGERYVVLDLKSEAQIVSKWLANINLLWDETRNTFEKSDHDNYCT